MFYVDKSYFFSIIKFRWQKLKKCHREGDGDL